MSQERLNSLMMLNANVGRPDKVNLVTIGHMFVEGLEHRQSIFGRFVPEDLQ